MANSSDEIQIRTLINSGLEAKASRAIDLYAGDAIDQLHLKVGRDENRYEPKTSLQTDRSVYYLILNESLAIMKMRQRTGGRPDSVRDRIIATAAELFHNNGYNATGIDQILKAARATKGSFHHHFGSKKEIALAVIKEIVAPKFNRRMIDPVVHAPKPLDAIRQVIRNLRTQVSTDDLLTGCPINNLSSELALQDRQIQSSLSALFDCWQNEWAKALRSQSDLEAQTGFRSPRQLALYIVAAIEGAQAMAKAQQSREPLDAVLKHLETTLRRSHD